jgi:hypothetical protein
LYEGQFIMATATTSAVWRSTGGDQTRTAEAGSMVMAVPFYIANTAATSNVVISSATGSPAVILPAGAVVTEVIISTAAGAGNSTANIGFTPLIGVGPGQTTTLGANVPAGFVSAGNVSARVTIVTGGTGGGASLGNVANATNLVVVTSAQGAANAIAGVVSGRIIYHVADAGQQSA